MKYLQSDWDKNYYRAWFEYNDKVYCVTANCDGVHQRIHKYNLDIDRGGIPNEITTDALIDFLLESAENDYFEVVK